MFKSKTSTLSYNGTLNSDISDHDTGPINPKETSKVKYLNVPEDRNRHSSIGSSKRSFTKYDGEYSADIIPAQLKLKVSPLYIRDLQLKCSESLLIQSCV